MLLTVHDPEAPVMPSVHVDTSPVETLQGQFVPTRVHFHWWGTRKTLSESQKQTAADVFGAEGDALSSGKQLINTKSDVYKVITKTKSQCRRFWIGCSLPFPEEGIRMIRADNVDEFVFELELYRAQLDSRVAELQAAWPDVLANAQSRLGQLWNPGDYPSAAQLPGLFRIEWDFPSVKPDEQLQFINPDLYEKERQKMIARFEVAADMAEDLFVSEMSDLIGTLVDKLQPGEDGKEKMIRASNVDKLNDFFATFHQLNLGGNSKLEELVEQVENAMSSVEVGKLRKSGDAKAELLGKLSEVSGSLEELVVNKPRRKILD